MWKVTLYKNTGLNSVNTIDKPSRLWDAQGGFASIAESIELPVLDILQAEFLNTVRVKAIREQVKDVDFMMLQNTEDVNDTFFYSVESFTSTSVDVQTLSITFDALLTLEFMKNGIENVEFLDGIVERHHVLKKDDKYGAYTEDDPLLVPSKELTFVATQMYNPVYSAEGSGTDVRPKTIIQSVTSLTDTNAGKASIYRDGDAYTAIPKTPTPVQDNTMFFFPLSDGNGQQYSNKSALCYDYEQPATREGMQILRDLGIERSSIVASYSLVSNFDFEGIDGTPSYFTMVGKYQEKTMDDEIYAFEYDKDVQNKRVLYGNSNMYEIISVASGVRMEFKPEDICTDDNGDILNSPIVCRASDPRPIGRPYYNFKFYRGINQSQHHYFSNAVPGMQWPSVPVVYTGLSGSMLNEIRYNTQREGETLAAQQSIDQMNYSLGEARTRRTIGLVTEGIQTIGNSVANPLSAASNVANYAGSIFQASADQAFDESRAQFNKSQLEERYAYNARKELQELQIANTIVAPDVHFPNSETLRDFLGNGIYVIQYRPQKSDRQKMDKILTMYGYKDTKTLENSDFTGRTKFNYVRANSVSIGGKDIPRWIREAAATQLANGVRMWHQLPDASVYTNGSNV